MRIALPALLVGCTSAAALTPRSGVQVYENARDHEITEGETTLAVDADTAYRTAAAVERWPSIFPDIHQVIVTERDGAEERVTFIHTDGNRDNVHFRNRPASRVLWFEDTGGRAQVWAEIAFLPGDRPGTTRVHTRLFAEVHGLASLFVSDDSVRAMREHRVQDDLLHLRTYFAHQAAR